MAALRSNAYYSTFSSLNTLPSNSAVETDQLQLTENGFQTIQPPRLSFKDSYTYRASASAKSIRLGYNIFHCQGQPWKVVEAKVGGVPVAWATTGTYNEFYIYPSLATGAGDCCGTPHTLDLKIEYGTPGKHFFLISFINFIR